MGMLRFALLLSTLVGGAAAGAESSHVLRLESDIDWSGMTCGRTGARPRGGFAVGGDRFLVGGVRRGDGVGTYAPSVFDLDVGGNALRFSSQACADDIATGSVVFNVYGDGKLLATSGELRAGMKPHAFDGDLSGVRTVRLEVAEGADGNSGDVADWLSPKFTFKAGTYPMNNVRMASPQLGILTPPPSKAPRINTPTRYGVRPGHELIYRIPVVGEDVRVRVGNLPDGVTFDARTRVLRGRIAAAGDCSLEIVAENAHGTAKKVLTVRVGEKIALTPPMGFNSWNCYQMHVTQEKMKRAADALVSSGLADHGYQYVVIDDFWMRDGEKDWPDYHAGLKGVHGPMRDANGRMNPNDNFPDMKGLADYVHGKGLKIGLYSSPGPQTCGGCAGSWQHEKIDAETFARWGYDFLKYDWCTYGSVATGSGLERAQRPYRLMGAFLRQQDRDILFSLCQYGGDNVSAWGNDVGGQMWRTTGDVFDAWQSVAGAIARQKPLWRYVKPGAWNDPDMLVVGPMCWNGFKGCRLAPNEQYTHVSMWAMCAAPLMIGCDMEKLDPLTLSLLTNDEIIAIDQDELGAAAACVDSGNEWEVWARPLADGSFAVALFNKALRPRRLALDMEKLGLECKWRVRDVWRQEDEGVFLGRYDAEVYGHATHVVKLSPLPCGHLRKGLSDIRR